MGVKNLARWNASLDEFGEKIEDFGLLFQKKVAFLVLGASVQTSGGIRTVSGLLHLTPVDTGRAVGNYQVSVGSPENSEVGGKFGAKGGGEGNRASSASKVNRRAARSLSGLRLGQSIWITNNLPYIVVLNDGGLNRTAHHMLERSIANARASMRSAS